MPLVIACVAAAIAPTRADLVSDITAVVEAQRSEHNVPGIVVGVWQGETNIAMVQSGFGNLNPQSPISADDYYRLGSVTKSFTVTRLLQLADQGLVNLDSPISTYVPGVQNGSATLRQLANMTSGIFEYSADATFQAEINADFLRNWTNQQLVDAADRNPPYEAPGGQWHYSNTNTVLLGMVVEAVGPTHNLATEIQNNILTPLGLSHTVYPVGTNDLPTPFTSGYDIISQPGEPVVYGDMTQSNPTSSSGSGAMIGTMDDMRIWAEALAKGTLLSPEMQAERLTLIPTTQLGPEYDAYGLGIGELNGWLGHTGAYFGYQNLVMYNPLTDQTIIIYTNLFYDGHIPTDIFRDIQGMVVPEPSVALLLPLGIAAVWFLRRKRA